VLWYVRESCWTRNRGLVPVLVAVLSSCYEIIQHKHNSWRVYMLLSKIIISTAYYYISLSCRWKRQQKKYGSVHKANVYIGNKWVMLYRNDFSFWFTLSILRAMKCPWKYQSTLLNDKIVKLMKVWQWF
jgi:hypothetical protein